MIRLIRNRIDGIAEPLPEGEVVLWSAHPVPWTFARRQFRLQWVAVWFLGLALWRATETLQAGGSGHDALLRALGQLPLAVGALGLLSGLGLAMARSTTYALTRRRLVMNVGVALPITINIPLRFIDGASVRHRAAGVSDLALTIAGGHKVKLFALWPHVRDPLARSIEPTLRDVATPSLLTLLPLLQQALRSSDADAAIAADGATGSRRPVLETTGDGSDRPNLSHGVPA